jgi:nicotinate-nucleotide adenylyltransferase
VNGRDPSGCDLGERVALFGGSFNPPHEGHVLGIVHALSTGAVARVLVVPVYEHALGKRLVAFEHRLEMARLAFDWIPGVEVSGIEAELGAPSRTLATIEALATRHPSWDLRLLVGSDILREIHQWHAFREIERRAPPLVLERAGDATAASGRCLLPEVSSTEVRALFANPSRTPTQDALLARLVPRRVRQYADRLSLSA